MENDILQLVLNELKAINGSLEGLQKGQGNLQKGLDEANQRINNLEICYVAMQADMSIVKTDISAVKGDVAAVKAKQIDDSEMIEIILGQTAELYHRQKNHGEEIEKLKIG